VRQLIQPKKQKKTNKISQGEYLQNLDARINEVDMLIKDNS
jgi:hypothetical protein